MMCTSRVPPAQLPLPPQLNGDYMEKALESVAVFSVPHLHQEQHHLNVPGPSEYLLQIQTSVMYLDLSV